MLVLRMYAEGYSIDSIRKEVKSQFDISILNSSLYDTVQAKKWQPFIKGFRDEYLAKVKSVPIANKRIRVDDLERERIRLNKLIGSCPTTTKSDKATYVSLVGELRRIIVEAREEMEKKPHLFQNVVVGMGDMSDEGLHRRKQELIARLRKSVGGGTSGADSDPGGVESEDQG